MSDWQARLGALREEAYADFTARAIPTVPRECILGVRAPLLRKLAADGSLPR